MPSLRTNVFYNGLLTVANYLFPLITYPYVSRVLGVTNIGICNFVDSIVNYFILFSMMGVSIVGVREIAAVRADRAERNRVFSSLLVLNGATTGIAAVALVIALFTVPALLPHRRMLSIGVVKLLANFLCMDWLFRGLEEFKYITSRSIIVKSLYVVAVFLLVRRPEDYPVYYLLLTLTLLANAAVNVFYARNYVSLRLTGLRFGPMSGAFFIMGLYMFLTSMYTSFNVAYLGFVSNPEQVGYYTSATKIFSMIIALFSAFTTVMLPRMSAVLSAGDRDLFLSSVSKSFTVFFTIGIPLILFMLFGSQDIVRIISGKGYEGAVVPMMTVSPLILVIAMEQILVIQVMMPMKWDRSIFVNSLIGALAGLFLNLLLARRFQAQGSAIVWLVSELVVFACALGSVSSRLSFRFPLRELLRNTAAYLPLVPLLFLLLRFGPENAFLRLGLEAVVLGVYFCALNVFVLKNAVVLDMVHAFRKRFAS